MTVIDDDLGRSGSGVSRPGFERLLAAICEGRVGAVFAIEASRLARNGRDWHTLIEFCGLVGTVIVDEDGTYEPRHPNDRLLLGMSMMKPVRAVALARSFDGSSEAEGATRRTLLYGGRWLRESWSRQDCDGPQPARARSDWAGLHPFCRDEASVRSFCRYVQTKSRCHTPTPKAPDNTSCCGSFQSIRR